MTIHNSTKWTRGGLDAIHVSYVGSGGFLAGWSNLTAASTNTGSGMRRLSAAQTAPFGIKEPVVKNILGDNGVFDTFTWASTDTNQGILEVGANDETFGLGTDGLTAKTVGIYTFYPTGGSVANPGTFAFLLTRDAHGQDSATAGSSGWENELIFYTKVKDLGDEDRAHQKEGKSRYLVTFNEARYLPFGTTSTTEFSVYSRQSMIWPSDKRSMCHCWVADGTATATTALDYTPDTATTTKAWDFTAGTALTVSSINTSTKVVTLSAAPTSGHIIFIIYQTASF